jgi:uncharacterized protein (DUF2236 family)
MPLSDAEKSAAFAEAQPAARLYGAVGAPRSWPEWEALLAEMAPSLEGSPVLTEFLDIMESAAILPRPLRWLQKLLVRAAVEMSPAPLRMLPQLRGRGLRAGEARILRLLGRTAHYLPLGQGVQAEAARRCARGAAGTQQPSWLAG